MTVKRRPLPCVIAVLVVLAALPLAAGDDSSPFRSDQKFANGLWMLTFQAPEGQIRLNMPERMWKGELASGTIELFPRGEGADFAANLAALREYSVRFGGEEQAASSRSFRWRPAETNSRIELIDRTGAAVSASPAIIASREGKRPEGPYALPTMVQRGNTFIVRGPFDGDFANTRLLLAGKPAEKVAESAELLVVRNTAERLGQLRAVVAEGAARQRATFNSFDISLSAPNGTAAPGGKMTVRLRIEGLEGMREPFQVALYNHHPEVASLEGARMPMQRVVRTEEIGADGAFQLDLGTSVKSAGQVSMFAAVAADPVPHMVDVTWAPHTKNVTYPPYHVPNITFPAHLDNVTFPPYHAVNVTFPPHTKNVTYPPGHVPNYTWAPHLENGTFPPYHVVNLTFPPHYKEASFPPYHQTNVTWPPHFPTTTFPPYHLKDASWPPHYVGFTFLPQKDDEVVVDKP